MAEKLRIPAIHDVRPDMTLFKSNARLLIKSLACKGQEALRRVAGLHFPLYSPSRRWEIFELCLAGILK